MGNQIKLLENVCAKTRLPYSTNRKPSGVEHISTIVERCMEDISRRLSVVASLSGPELLMELKAEIKRCKLYRRHRMVSNG